MKKEKIEKEAAEEFDRWSISGRAESMERGPPLLDEWQRRPPHAAAAQGARGGGGPAEARGRAEREHQLEELHDANTAATTTNVPLVRGRVELRQRRPP